MKKCAMILVVALAVAAQAVQGADTVRTRTSRLPLSGRVTQMSPLEVTLEEGAARVARQIPVNEVLMIIYEEDPTSLKSARVAAVEGRFQDCLSSLDKIQADDVSRKEIKDEIAFYKALCTAKLALGGQGELSDAGNLMKSFVADCSDNYHYLQASEVLGDLLVAAGSYAKALECYDRLAKTSWPEYKMRAGVLIGRALVAQKEIDKAQKAFQEVLSSGGEGAQAQAQKQAATLGIARCYALGKQPDQAVKMAEDIIAKADPDQGELYAQAYNILGTALRKSGRSKEALLAFLHVDVLYSNYPDAHAESLANLADLWTDANKVERAARCRQLLKEDYGNSRWARSGAK